MASADILRAAHSPLPWLIEEDSKTSIWSGGHYVAEAYDGGEGTAAFIHRACNAHYQMLEALKALDAWWTDSFPAGPDAADVSYGFGKLSEDTLAIWRQVRAAIAAAEAEAGR